jgi:hypothetical protein
MKTWVTKKILSIALVFLDSWITGELTPERALRWRQMLEGATIGRAMRLEQRPYWKRKKSNNAFAEFMTILLKSNRLTDFDNKKS